MPPLRCSCRRAGYLDGAPAHARLLTGRRRRVVDLSIRAEILEWAVGHRARAVPDRGRRRSRSLSADGVCADARRPASRGEGRGPPGLPAVAERDTVTREARGPELTTGSMGRQHRPEGALAPMVQTCGLTTG